MKFKNSSSSKKYCDVHYFNASSEMAIANGTSSYMPPKFIRKLESDFAPFSLFFAEKEDVVLIDYKLSEYYENHIIQIKGFLPKQIKSSQFALLEKTKLGWIRPWGWSLATHKFFSSLKKQCHHSFLNAPVSRWQEHYKELYSRPTALDILCHIINHSDTTDLLVTQDRIPQKATTVEEVKKILTSEDEIFVKAPWSCSGRGIIRLTDETFHATYDNWISGVLKNQGFVMVESALDKVCDLSFHFELEAQNELHYLGYNLFTTAENAQYTGNLIHVKAPEGIDYKVFQELLEEAKRGLNDALKKSPIFSNYSGYLGVDALIYKDKNGNLRIQPCIEVNLRCNMGTLSLLLQDVVCEESKGYWEIENVGKNALEYHQKMEEKYPLKIIDGKIEEGYFPLNDPYNTHQFLAYMVIDKAL